MNSGKGLLSMERIERLNHIHFMWNPQDTHFEERLAELEAYQQLHGHCNVTSSQNSILATWCGTQWNFFKKGKLTEERIERLECIGFEWDVNESKFAKMYAELMVFLSQNGHCDAGLHDGILGRWCVHIRSDYKNNRLSEERIRLLTKLGFTWDTLDDKFQKYFRELKQFKREHGHVHLPYRYGPLRKRRDEWRYRKRQNKLSPTQVEQLDELGFIWDPNEVNFSEMLGQLEAFKAELSRSH